MKRRRILQSILTLPAASALSAQEHKVNPQQPPVQAQPAVIEENPKLATVTADGICPPRPGFFTADQLSALATLSKLIFPASETSPGAEQAGVAEFLDFYVSEAPLPQQKLYRDGLDQLNRSASKLHKKAFAELRPEQADSILEPLKAPWTYDGPRDPFARFLLAAKNDIIAATANSREWIAAVSARSRSAGGTGAYWFPIEPLV